MTRGVLWGVGVLLLLAAGGSYVLLLQRQDAEDAVRGTRELIGEPVYGDVNGDLANDKIAFFTASAGEGTRYYLGVEVQQEPGMYVGTNMLVLGDDILPGTITIQSGVAAVAYSAPAAGAPQEAVKYVLVDERGILRETSKPPDWQ